MPNTTINHTTTAETGIDKIGGIPNSPPAAAMPANFAMVTAPLATSGTNMAGAVQRTPNCSRISSARPFPVTEPSRATWI
jgi:hypothetical protein